MLQYCAILQIYTLEQEKRGLCPYDDKRYLLADLPDGSPNPNTHAYGHYELQSEERLQVDMPDRPGTELVIEQRQPRQEAKSPKKPEEVEEPYHTSLLVVKRELRYKRRHARVEKTLAKRSRRNSNKEDISKERTSQCRREMRTVSSRVLNSVKRNEPRRPNREPPIVSEM